jgi:hypothetical protein
MSIKLLLISSDEKFLQEIKKNYKNHIERGFFEFFTPKEIENNPVKYEVIITEKKYLSMIPVEDLPIIVTDKISDDEMLKNNIVSIKQPMDFDNLYEVILRVQYIFKSPYLTKIQNPNIKLYTHSPIQNKKKQLYIKQYEDDYKKINDENQENISMKIEEKYEKIYESKEEEKDKEKISNTKLSTKFYHLEDIKKVNNILTVYGEKNLINDKVIAQASIILDELVYILESLSNDNNIFNNKEPKILMKMNNSNKEFNINLECLIPMEKNIQNLISIAENYGNTIESFKRNNSYYINICWEL